MKEFILKTISFYQKHSQYTKKNCVFFPTCSEYTKEAIEKYGVLKGALKGLKRISRCHPWQKNNYDPLE